MELFTVAEVASRLRISVSAVYELIQDSTLPCHRIGPRRGAIRVSGDDLAWYLQQCRHEVQDNEHKGRTRLQLKHLRV
jgi:excisionase family DNA binding protein